MKFFSVIIPSFNRAHTLLRALDSVYKQSFVDFDCIVIDDGSTDNTQKLVEGYVQDKENFYYLKTQNRGVSAARNTGVAYTQSHWLTFLDSDDEWLPEKLEKQFDYIQSHPEYLLVHTDEIWIRNGVRVNPKTKYQKAGGDIFEACTQLCAISPSTVAIERKYFKSLGGFDEEFIICEDYDLWLKVTSQSEVGYLDEKLTIKYGGHEDQLSLKYFAMDEWRIKSLLSILKTDLSENKREQVKKVLKEKLKILEAGAKKHSNQDLISKVNFFQKQFISFSE